MAGERETREILNRLLNLRIIKHHGSLPGIGFLCSGTVGYPLRLADTHLRFVSPESLTCWNSDRSRAANGKRTHRYREALVLWQMAGLIMMRAG